MFGGRFGLHHGDLFDLALQDQEAVVVQVDAVAAQQLRHGPERRPPTVHLPPESILKFQLTTDLISGGFRDP